ncbi:MAG: DUF1552 domain-containing protein [Opitutales bacterium]
MLVNKLGRRSFLRGLGASISLPPLCLSEPFQLNAQDKTPIPLRMGFAYIPNGVIMENWKPKELGTHFTLPSTLSPLEDRKADIQVLSGLDHTKANSNGDGGGDHARANATFLTGCQARKTAGSNIKVGKSVDQIAASQIGDQTKLPSLELSGDKSRRSGKCDSGYSCAYQFNLSWKTESMPMSPESNPRLVFERLFGKSGRKEDSSAVSQRLRHDRSILDFVLEDAKSLHRRLGRDDREKIDEYFVAVRELEKRIEKTEGEKFSFQEKRPPEGIPQSYQEHLRLMFDMMALAFQTDSTRISSFLLAHDGSNRSFSEVGVPEGHHSLSHHRDNDLKKTKLAKIDRFYVEQFSYFLEKLYQCKEKDGSRLLDHCMILYGGGISDGNRHRHVDLPVLLAGGKAHGLQTGRHHDFSSGKYRISSSLNKDGLGMPMTNLHLGLLNKMGVDADQIGDSTGTTLNI